MVTLCQNNVNLSMLGLHFPTGSYAIVVISAFVFYSIWHKNLTYTVTSSFTVGWSDKVLFAIFFNRQIAVDQVYIV